MNMPGFTAELSAEAVSETRFAGSLQSPSGLELAVSPAFWRRFYCAVVCAACGKRDAGEACWRCSRCEMTGDAPTRTA
jgi:hypothetical protein